MVQKPRTAKWLKKQRKIEEDFKKKYPEVMGARGGELLPPTIWSYRHNLKFMSNRLIDDGYIEEQAALGEGCSRTRMTVSEY